MDVLEAPAVLHQFHGQPVQQFRVGRIGRLPPEIFGCLNDSCSEMALPEAIHYGPGGGGRAAVY